MSHSQRNVSATKSAEEKKNKIKMGGKYLQKKTREIGMWGGVVASKQHKSAIMKIMQKRLSRRGPLRTKHLI